MKMLKKLNADLKDYLDSNSEQLINDIKSLLLFEKINYIENKQKIDIQAFNFEYLHDYLNISFFCSDQNGFIITETLELPTKRNSKLMFIPEIIWNQVNEFEMNYSGKNLDNILKLYNDEKYEIFDSWFIMCWELANKKINIKIASYLSIAELDFGIELNSHEMIEIGKEQPNRRRFII